MYGTDFQRQQDISLVPKAMLLVTSTTELFIILSSITLYVGRRIFKLPRASIALSIMDCLIPFYGGGSLRMQHRFERWFFGIMLFSAFLIMAVFGGDLIDAIVQIQSFKIATFDDLAKVNVKHVHWGAELGMYHDEIFKMLRFSQSPSRFSYIAIIYMFLSLNS